MVENAAFATGILMLSVIAPEISISGFGNNTITISGCRSLLQSLADTFFELCLVVNLRFAIGISMLYCNVSEICRAVELTR